MKIILYSNDCPRCKVLEKKLGQKNVSFELNKDPIQLVNLAEQVGLSSAPLLVVDDQCLDFAQANQFINDL